MAFGDITQDLEVASSSSSTTFPASFDSEPASGALLVGVHMTGADTSTGFTSDTGSNVWADGLEIHNTTESDDTHIYHRIAGASEDQDCVASAGASDEHGIILLELDAGTNGWKAEGDVVDVAEEDGRDASGTSYAMGATAETAQDNEVGVAAVYTRNTGNNDNTTFSNDYVGDQGRGIASSNKTIAVAVKVLTTKATQSTTYTFTSDTVSQGGIITYMENTPVAGLTPPEIITMLNRDKINPIRLM